MISLANVDNTTDLNKPIRTATQTTLNSQSDASDITKTLLDLETLITQLI